MTISPVHKAFAVLVNEFRVGTLTYLSNDENVFRLDDEYMVMKDPPAFSLSRKSATGTFIRTLQRSRTRLPPFFSNLLPEGSLRDYLAQRVGTHPDREFALLSELRDDLPGAIALRPIESDERLGALDSAVGDAGSNHQHALRFSLAGVQLKFSALIQGTRGLTIPARGVGGEWIVKLPSTRFANVPENEYAVMTLAKDAGLDVAEVALVETKDIENLPENLPENFGNSLAVRRFDRESNGRRIHIEDFAQVYDLRPADKYGKASYGNMADVLWTETGEDGLVEFIKRLIFAAATGNADMHLKNWSLIYRDGRTPQLAPAYDLLSTVLYLPDYQLALSLGGTKNMHELSIESFRKMAAKARLPEQIVLKAAQEAVSATHQSWQNLQNDLPISKEMMAQISSHMDSVPIMKGK